MVLLQTDADARAYMIPES